MAGRRLSALGGVLFVLAGCATVGNKGTVQFSSVGRASQAFTGTLTLPERPERPAPVVVLVHGSAGVDSRYDFHRLALLDAGIGTFEVDFKSGVFTGLSDRPPVATFHPFAFGALRALRADPRIDPERIAIMGFSLGGHVSVSAASKRSVEQWLGPKGSGFAAHVGFYPVCNRLQPRFEDTEGTGAPILILAGSEDSWGDGTACPKFADWLNAKHPGLVRVKIYPGVHHGFDRAGAWEGYAPLARNEIGILHWDEEAAYDGRQRAVSFLREAFGMRSRSSGGSD